ncbi:MAG: hypothetical protein IPN17_21760 [Deltaproteobacteria bacterium]|nr:hypothetical protein [Deltaproteobacteria bacterium]
MLPLRGLKQTEWPTYECDLLPANPFSPNAGDVDAVAFRGVTLRVWPNLKRPTNAWRYYVVGIQAATEEGMALFSQGRMLRARMLVPPSDVDGRPTSETRSTWSRSTRRSAARARAGPRASSAPPARGGPPG